MECVTVIVAYGNSGNENGISYGYSVNKGICYGNSVNVNGKYYGNSGSKIICYGNGGNNNGIYCGNVCNGVLVIERYSINAIFMLCMSVCCYCLGYVTRICYDGYVTMDMLRWQ